MTIIEYAKKYAPNVIGDNGYPVTCPYILGECFKPYAEKCASMKNCGDCWNQEIDIDALNCALSDIGENNVDATESCEIVRGKDYIVLHDNNGAITIKKSAITSVGNYHGKTIVTFGNSCVTADENYNDVVNAVFDA